MHCENACVLACHIAKRFDFQLRDKSNRISSLEEQLQDKTSQCTHQASRIKHLEEEVTAHENEAQALHRELREKLGGAESAQEERERVQKIHKEQCQDYQKQIDIVRQLTFVVN